MSTFNAYEIPEPTALDFTRRLRQAFGRLGSVSEKLDTGFARIVNGEVPNGSGNPIGSNGVLTDYVFMPGRSNSGNFVNGLDDSPALTMRAGGAIPADGNVGVPAARFSMGTSGILDIRAFNFGNTFEAALTGPTGTGTPVFFPSSDGTSGFRITSTTNRTFLQCGLRLSSGNVQNASMTTGAAGARVGIDCAYEFKYVTLSNSGTVLSDGTAINAGTSRVGVNLRPADYTSAMDAGFFARSVATSSPAVNAEVNADFAAAIGVALRSPSTGSAPNKLLGSILATMEEDRTNTSYGSVGLYNAGTWRGSLTVQSAGGTDRMTVVDGSSRLLWQGVVNATWADSVTTTQWLFGDVQSSNRYALLASAGSNKFGRLGICATSLVIGDVTAGVIPAPVSSALVTIVNSAATSMVKVDSGGATFISPKTSVTASLRVTPGTDGTTADTVVIDGPSGSAADNLVLANPSGTYVAKWTPRGQITLGTVTTNPPWLYINSSGTDSDPSGLINRDRNFIGALMTNTTATGALKQPGNANPLVNFIANIANSTGTVDSVTMVGGNMTLNHSIGTTSGMEYSVTFGGKTGSGGTAAGRALTFFLMTQNSVALIDGVGVEINCTHSATGTITDWFGGRYGANTDVGAGTASNVYGMQLNSNLDGNTTASYGLHISSPTGAGTVGTRYGINLGDQTFGSTSWALYSLGGQSSHLGSFSFGSNSAPAAIVDVTQATLGNAAQIIRSTATNDDPTETVLQDRVATTDGTTTTLHSFTIPATTTVFIHARVVARRTGGAAGTAEDGAGYIVTATVKNVAGTATLVGAVDQDVVQEDQAGWDATIDVTGATARVRVTGAVNNNVTWHLTARSYAVSS